MRARSSNLAQAASGFVYQVSGEEFKIVPGAARQMADRQSSPPSFRPVAEKRPVSFVTRLEFSVAGGQSRFGNRSFSTEDVDLVIPLQGTIIRSVVSSPTALLDGLTFAPRVTLNGRRVSHEFAYVYNSASLSIGFNNPAVESSTVTGAAQIRQFSYNALIHARPNGARVRPYLAVGPGFQVVRLREAMPAEANAFFNFAFKDAGLILNAWNFGKDPAFEGGGIFQPTVQYGVGVKAYFAPRAFLRADFRETLSAQPDFWSKSYPTLRATELDNGVRLDPQPLSTSGPLRHQQISVGIGFAF